MGNGISLLIFSGIVSWFPAAIGQMFESARQGNLNIIVLLAMVVLAIGLVWIVVRVERGQRRVPISYAKRQQVGDDAGPEQSSSIKGKYGGSNTRDFRFELLLAPASMASWFGSNQGMDGCNRFLSCFPRVSLCISCCLREVLFSSPFFIRRLCSIPKTCQIT